MGRVAPESVVGALAAPGFYPHRPARVEHVQTHISHVFLAGPYVYKLKKPLRLSFLDFSTAELRRHYCEEEVHEAGAARVTCGQECRSIAVAPAPRKA